MRQLGDRSWLGAVLLVAPRWPYAAPLALLVPWALVARRWMSLGMCAVSSAALLTLVMGMQLNVGGAAGERGALRVLTCNIHRQHLDPAKLARFLDEVAPDIVALQGWSDLHKEDLFADPSWNCVRDGELLLASRHRIETVRVLNLAEDASISAGEQGAAGLYSIALPDRTVHVLNLHLASPHAGLNSMWTDRGQRLSGNVERRKRELQQVRELADSVPGTLFVTGDFNTTTESPLFREAWEGFSDAFLASGVGLGYTYLINHTQIRIDHILADASVTFARCWVGPDVNAAHRPLVADVEFR